VPPRDDVPHEFRTIYNFFNNSLPDIRKQHAEGFSKFVNDSGKGPFVVMNNASFGGAIGSHLTTDSQVTLEQVSSALASDSPQELQELKLGSLLEAYLKLGPQPGTHDNPQVLATNMCDISENITGSDPFLIVRARQGDSMIIRWNDVAVKVSKALPPHDLLESLLRALGIAESFWPAWRKDMDDNTRSLESYRGTSRCKSLLGQLPIKVLNQYRERYGKDVIIFIKGSECRKVLKVCESCISLKMQDTTTLTMKETYVLFNTDRQVFHTLLEPEFI